MCWRAKNSGLVIKYISKSIVYHIGGATLQAGNPKKTFLNFRNSLLMLTKNLPKSSLIPILFFRMILDGIAGMKFLFTGKLQHFIAIMQAHFAFYCLFLQNYRKRKKNQIATYYYLKSIVFTYYIKSGKVFEKLKK